MGKRLYCGNLPYSATADDVKAIFGEGGRTVTDVHIVMDRETGRSRGFAFVEVSSDEEAVAAIREVDGKMYSGRALTVKEARERESRPSGPRPGGFGGPRPNGGPSRGPSGSPGGFGGAGGRSGGSGGFGGPRPPRGPAYPPPPDYAPPLPPPPVPVVEYTPPDDGDYRDRSDRGKRGRDRRGGRRRGDDFGGEGW